MARVVRPGGRVVILEITTPQQAAAELVLPALVRPGSCRCWAAAAGDSRRLHVPARLGAPLPARRRSWPRCMDAARAARRPLPAAGGRHRRDPLRHSDGMSRSDEVILLGGESDARTDGARRGPAGRDERRAAAPTCTRPRPTRSRPAASGCARCWCSSAEARSDEQDLVRAATAVELVHMATLVHDDVVDAAPLRRGRPTVFARDGRETRDGDRRLPVLACVRAAGRERRSRSRCGCSPTRAWRLPAASSRSATTPSAPDVDERALPAALRAQDRQPVRGRLRARRARGRPVQRGGDCARALRPPSSASPSRCSTTCST